jgi:tetratricopeptide (TPR) repeat protein
MVGRHSPQSPSIRRLTLQPETISSRYRRVRHTQFQPHPGRHRLKLVSQSLAKSSGPSKPSFEPAIDDFRRAAQVLSSVQDSYFKSIALPSAQVLQGIAHVYGRELDQAEAAFKLATKASYPDLRARAYNNLGYVKLIRGEVTAGVTLFLSALAEDGSFPYARSNLGNSYLAEGRYDAAREVFKGISQDAQLQSESMRDVMLARAALAHIDAQTGRREAALTAYKDVLN